MRFLLAALLVLTVQESRADCASFSEWLGENVPTFVDTPEVDLRIVCSDPRWLATIAVPEAVAQAKPVTDLAALEGTWRGTFWFFTATGMTVPVVEVLDIAASGEIIQRARRWFDPTQGARYQLGRADILHQGHAVLEPVLTTGKLVAAASGGFRVENRLDWPAALELTVGEPEIGRARDRLTRFGMSDLARPISAALAGDVLVLRGDDGRTRTYRRTSAEALDRAHALVRAAEIAASLNWPCLADRLDAGDPTLTRFGDFARESEALGDFFAAIDFSYDNARLSDPEYLRDAKKAAFMAISKASRALRERPVREEFETAAVRPEPFGCPAPFWR